MLPVGSLVDQKYSIVRVLGQGGMGVVYLARDVHTDLDVVVKAVRRDLAHRPDMRARTLAEGRALATIDHPNVVQLKSVVVDGDDLWLVMQFIDGDTLDKLISRYKSSEGGMPLDQTLSIFRQIVAGVGAAHREGVIHRDLKPANVIVRKKDGVAKVTDFGIAKVQKETDGAHTKGIIGSLWYMSPEQVRGLRDLDARVDVYALGILLYQMLLGRVPFNAQSDYDIMKLQAEAPMPLVRDGRPDVPPEVDAIIQKACAKNRDERYPTADELHADLEKLSIGGRSTAEVAAALREAAPPSAAQGGVPTTANATGAGPAVTATGTEVSIERPRRSGAMVALIVGLVGVAAGVGALFGFGVIRLDGGRRPTKSTSSADVRSNASTLPTSPPAPKGPLDAFVGSWVGNGRELEAVVAGDVLEFRVKNPMQFAPQDYEVGEARFALRATSEPTVFTVEDRIRPNPPAGRSFDPHSRGTCQEVWTTAGNEPLRARYDGTRLSVEFAKIEPSDQNFMPGSGRITSCVGLRGLRTVRVVSTLTRSP